MDRVSRLYEHVEYLFFCHPELDSGSRFRILGFKTPPVRAG